MTVSADVDERTLREIYLPAFETVVAETQPWTIMSSYNRINGVYVAQSPWLLTEVLRYDGVSRAWSCRTGPACRTDPTGSSPASTWSTVVGRERRGQDPRSAEGRGDLARDVRPRRLACPHAGRPGDRGPRGPGPRCRRRRPPRVGTRSRRCERCAPEERPRAAPDRPGLWRLHRGHRRVRPHAALPGCLGRRR